MTTSPVGTPGFVVLITISLKLLKLLSAGTEKSLIAFPAASFKVAPLESAILLTAKSLEASPLCTVYVPVAEVALLTDVMLTVRSVLPVSKVTTTEPLLEIVTASVKLTVILISPPVP